MQSTDPHRQQFPALAHHAYFNFGGQGPLPAPALEAIHRAFQHFNQITPFSIAAERWSVEQMELTRRVIAGELGVAPNTIALTEDVTVGCNIALWGIDWQAGDLILLSDCEHPGVVAAVREIQRRFQVDVDTFPLEDSLNACDRLEPVTRLADALTPNTRLVVLSHVLWNTGQVLPLQEMIQVCRHYDVARSPIQVLVDAAQSVGALPLNLAELDVDYYAFTGHKWWCGPAGVGGLYIHPDRLQGEPRDRVSPTFIGWRGIVVSDRAEPTGWQPGSKRFEVATSAVPLYLGLRAALELHQAWGGAAQRYQAILAQSQALWESLSSLPTLQCLRTLTPPESGLISFQLKDQGSAKAHLQLVETLEQQGIFLRTLKQPRCIRASVHYLTTNEDCDRLISALQQF
jgi:L-cysteine/cystine lyase